MQQQHPNFANILQYLTQNTNYGNIKIHQKINIQPHSLVTENQFSLYSEQIKNIYNEIFTHPNDHQQNQNLEINLTPKLFFEIRQTAMPICNKILTVKEPVFRCYDCMTHQASVLCKNCFQNANHKGHRYSQISSGGGNCDCGNPDAIKPQGFCVHHPGKAEPVIVDESEQQHFLEVTLTLLQWTFRLYEKSKPKSSDILGQLIADFLNKMNSESLYYNTLTFMLFFGKRRYGSTSQQRQQKIINKIFEYGIKLVNFAKKITDVFFSMFSLQIFKYELTVSFTEAYNKIKNFQSSKFKSLYIQLFANNDILEKMLQQKKLVLYPQFDDYDFNEYIENLMFLSTIKPEVASKFFVLLIHKGHLRFPEMDQIQQKVQQNGEHIVNIINQNLNTQNFYYILMQSIFQLLQNHPSSLIQMLRHYSNLVMDTKYSYKKNKVVMPFHKILSMIILSIYKGKVENINYQQLQKYLQNKHSAIQIVTKVFKMIMECFKQFSKTFFETSYFDNYIPLYVKSGNTIVVFDLLMFSICLEIFNQVQSQRQMNEILFSIFEIETQKKQSKSAVQKIQLQQKQNKDADLKQFMLDSEPMDDQNDYEDIPESQSNESSNLKTLKKNVQLIKIMIEACISDRSQILVANSIKIQSSDLKFRTQNLFVGVMNNFKQITSENLKQLNRNLIGTKNIQEDLIKKFLTFDKNKKKYILNQLKDQKYTEQKFPLYLCSTLKKFGGIFAQQIQNSLEDLIANIQLTKQKIEKIQFLFNEKFVYHLSKQFINSLIEFNTSENKQIKKIFLDFVQVMKILQHLMKNNSLMAINDLFNRLAELSQKEQFYFLSQKVLMNDFQEQKQQQKLSNKLKFEEKKKKKLQKMKKMQATFDPLLNDQKIEQEQNESKCIICREDRPGLCFLASFNYSNILQVLNKVNGRSLVFKSCFHPIHISCFIKASNHSIGYLPCPLCKTQSNIMLPFQKQLSNISTVTEVYERIITIRTTFQESYQGFDKKFDQFGILTIFRALCSMIGKNIIRKQPIIYEKDQRLANILYSVAQNIFKQQFNPKRMNDQQQGIKQFLSCLKQQINEQKSEQTNFYAFEYVTCKILYNCFKQKPDKCVQLLNQPQASLIAKDDLRKIWQMCNQIVSLPLLSEKQNKFQLKEMSSKIDFYSPPETVFDLIQIRDQQNMVCKNGHQTCICIICKQKGCYDCKQIQKHMNQVHCGEGVGFNLLTGGLMYIIQGKIIHIPSLYSNQMGFEWRPSKSAEGFILDNQLYEQLKKQILNQSIMKFLCQKYPEAMKKSLFYEMNIL